MDTGIVDNTADTGVPTGVVKYVRSVVSNEKEVLTACTFLLNDFLLKWALEGVPFWCDIKVTCLLLCCESSLKLFIFFMHRMSDWPLE